MTLADHLRAIADDIEDEVQDCIRSDPPLDAIILANIIISALRRAADLGLDEGVKDEQ